MSEAANSEDDVLCSAAARNMTPFLARPTPARGERSQEALEYVARRVAEARAILSAPADVERAPARSLLRNASLKR